MTLKNSGNLRNSGIACLILLAGANVSGPGGLAFVSSGLAQNVGDQNRVNQGGENRQGAENRVAPNQAATNELIRINNNLNADQNIDNGDNADAQAAPVNDPFAGVPLNVGLLRRGNQDNGLQANGVGAARNAGNNAGNNGPNNGPAAGNQNAAGGLNQNRAANADALTADQLDEIALRDNRQAAQRSNIRAPVVEAGTPAALQDDPYAPIGIRIGSLRLTSIVEQSIGYSSNRQGAALGEGGGLSLTTGEFRLRSEWERHQLSANLIGEYERFFDNNIEPNPQVDLDANIRFDLRDGYDLTFGGNYSFTTEAATSINLNDVTINEPAIHGTGAFVQLQRTGHKLSFQLRGSLARNSYEAAKLAGGGTLSQGDRDVNNYSLLGRLGYEISPALSPFVQARITKAEYDQAIDRNGERRDSNSYDLRGGFAFDLSEKFNGEISVGYSVLDYPDAGLANLAGFVTNADINWSPQRDTNVNLVVGSELAGSTVANDSGSITYNAQLNLTRRVRDNLDLNGSITASFVDYSDLGRTDLTYGASIGFDYWLNRNFAIIGNAQYDVQDSSSAADSFDVARFVLGVRLQK